MKCVQYTHICACLGKSTVHTHMCMFGEEYSTHVRVLQVFGNEDKGYNTGLKLIRHLLSYMH